MAPARDDLVGLYERYLARCNEHRFDELGDLVAEEVSGSGAVDGLAGYVARLHEVHRGFPDYHWQVEGLVVEGDTLAVRLTGRGTHTGEFGGIAPTGRRVEVQELVVYRVDDDRIAACWGDFFPVVRDALRGGADLTR